MSSLAWVLILVLTLTVVGSLALLLVTLKYYWGERGRPPASREERRILRQRELELRAQQIEYAKRNPVKPRKPDFWDNRKND
jgi:hypothetical protein